MNPLSAWPSKCSPVFHFRALAIYDSLMDIFNNPDFPDNEDFILVFIKILDDTYFLDIRSKDCLMYCQVSVAFLKFCSFFYLNLLSRLMSFPAPLQCSIAALTFFILKLKNFLNLIMVKYNNWRPVSRSTKLKISLSQNSSHKSNPLPPVPNCNTFEVLASDATAIAVKTASVTSFIDAR